MRHLRTPEGSLRLAARELAALVLLLALAACERPTSRVTLAEKLATLERPNLVLIVVDTLRADWTSAYGYERDTTPELTRWANRGVLFERARAQSSWTKISMASLMTSLWPRSHAIRESDDGLSTDALTLADVLHEAGYRTYGIQTNGWLHPSFGFHQGFDRYVFPIGKGARGVPRSALWPHADRVYEEFLRLIEAHDSKQPFFLYVHFMDVHQYGAPNEFKHFGTGDRGDYLAAIRWVDDALQRMRVALDRQGLLDDSIVVFVSDHGEEFGEHGVIGHARNVHTPVLRVPLVLRLPFPMESVRVTTQVRNLDIAPTLLDLAKLPVPDGFEGRSLVPLMTRETPEDEPDRLSFASLGTPLFLDARIQESVNDGAWSYARNVPPDPDSSEYLFDRALDPDEQVNLILLEKSHALRLESLLREHRESTPAPGVRAPNVRIDPAIAERLRAMGYLE
jgi:arylsulfatase A-like enzyme